MPVKVFKLGPNRWTAVILPQYSFEKPIIACSERTKEEMAVKVQEALESREFDRLPYIQLTSPTIG